MASLPFQVTFNKLYKSAISFSFSVPVFTMEISLPEVKSQKRRIFPSSSGQNMKNSSEKQRVREIVYAAHTSSGENYLGRSSKGYQRQERGRHWRAPTIQEKVKYSSVQVFRFICFKSSKKLLLSEQWEEVSKETWRRIQQLEHIKVFRLQWRTKIQIIFAISKTIAELFYAGFRMTR